MLPSFSYMILGMQPQMVKYRSYTVLGAHRTFPTAHRCLNRSSDREQWVEAILCFYPEEDAEQCGSILILALKVAEFIEDVD